MKARSYRITTDYKIIRVLYGKDLSNIVSQHDVTYFQRELQTFGLLGKDWDTERPSSWDREFSAAAIKIFCPFSSYTRNCEYRTLLKK